MTNRKVEKIQKKMTEHMTYIMLLGKNDEEATMYVRDVINLLGDIHRDLDSLKDW